MSFGTGINFWKLGYIYYPKVNIMDKTIETDKLIIAYDKYYSSFLVTMYDKYGHYIDETELSREDIAVLYKGLDEIKEKILD